jgi:hypothetical protein
MEKTSVDEYNFFSEVRTLLRGSLLMFQAIAMAEKRKYLNPVAAYDEAHRLEKQNRQAPPQPVAS